MLACKAVLTHEQRRARGAEMARRVREGEPIEEVAARYGVTAQAIKYYLKRN